jgi:hypothetical protein
MGRRIHLDLAPVLVVRHGRWCRIERLRTTVHQYRTFWNRLEDFSREA